MVASTHCQLPFRPDNDIVALPRSTVFGFSQLPDAHDPGVMATHMGAFALPRKVSYREPDLSGVGNLSVRLASCP